MIRNTLITGLESREFSDPQLILTIENFLNYIRSDLLYRRETSPDDIARANALIRRIIG